MLIGIFGTGRNGSSLIGHLLDGLEDTYVHPVEEKFLTAFNDIAANGRVSRLVEQNCICHALKKLNQKIRFEDLAQYFQLSLDTLYEHCKSTKGSVQEVKPLGLHDVVTHSPIRAEQFVQKYLEGLGRKLRPDIDFKHHLFKSIETPYIKEYERIFPDMRFIHILRHPVPVCSSQKRSLMENKKLPASYLGFDWMSCMLDMRWVPHAMFLKDRIGDSRHITVRYEDLVADPVGEIVRIADSLGISPPPRPDCQTIFYNLSKTKWGTNPSKKGVESPAGVVANLQKINRYDEVLTTREIDVIAMKTRDLLDQFNYDSPSDASKLKILIEYLFPDKWEFMHCYSIRYIIRIIFGLFYRRLALIKTGRKC